MTDEDFTYDAIANAYAAAIDEAPYNQHYERPTMLGLLPPMEGLRILEAGCGAGWYTARLLERGARVTALDASARLVEHARRRVAEMGDEVARRCDFHVADLRRPLGFAADAGFDGAVSALVMHYLRDWSTPMREFRRVLKPGGWLLLSTHHPSADASRLRPGESYFDVVQEKDHWRGIGDVRFFRRPLMSIAEALADAGFGIERIVEPRPTEAFRAAKPDGYERLMRFPEFIYVLARPWP